MDPAGRAGLSRRRSRLRAAVYGVLALAAAGLGCNLKSCSCNKLPTGLLTKPAKEKRAFTDVEMLSDGSEPRVELRVARWVGLKYEVVLESGGSIAFEGQPAPFGPTIVMTLEHEVLRGSADPILVPRDGGVEERIEERVTIEDLVARHADAPPAVVEGWNRALVPFRGSTLRQEVTASAGIASMKTELVGGVTPPEDVLRAVDSSLEAQRHFPFRLPATPVGVGARWRFRESVVLNGVAAAQIADMTLKSIGGDTAVVGIVLRQEAPRQEVPNPLVPGKKAVLESFRGDGEGELVVDRLTAVLLKGRLAGASRLVMTGEVNGERGTARLVGANFVTARSKLLTEADTEGAPRAKP